MGIRKSDIEDADFIETGELESDGYLVYLPHIAISLITSGTSVISIFPIPDGEGLTLTDLDHPVSTGDRVHIYNTSGNLSDGYYTIASIINDTMFDVVENIVSSIGGFVDFMFPSGASITGFNSLGLNIVAGATNVESAISNIDEYLSLPAGGDLSGSYPNPTVIGLQDTPVATTIPTDGYVLTFVATDGQWEPKPISGSSSDTDVLTSIDHPALRQLIHLADGIGGPFEGFLSGAYRETTGPLIAPTNVIWYVDTSKAQKIVAKTIVYNSVLCPVTITWNSYASDGYTVLATVIDSINYAGVFEINRSRHIIDYDGSCDMILTIENHKSLRQLIHLADGIGGPFEAFPSGAYREITPLANPFPTSVIWYIDNTKAMKIVEKNIAYNGVHMPISVVWKVYAIDGITVLATATDNIVYVNNIFEINRTRIIS